MMAENNNCTTVDHLTMLALRCAASSNAKFLELTETVAAALEEVDNNKQDKLHFDTTPTQGSANPVTSDGVYKAISAGGGVEVMTVAQIRSICI